MPANPKYLTTATWAQVSKLTAAILGSLIASMTLHVALASWLNPSVVWGTSVFTLFILWLGLIVVTYWVRQLWHIWGILLFITLVSIGAIYFEQSF